MSFSRYTLLLHALIFTSIFDSSGVSIGSFTLRIAWAFAPLATLFVKSKKITLPEIAFLLFFSFFHLASLLYNSTYAGFSYIIWIIFNFFIFYRIAASREFFLYVDISKLFVVSGRLQIIIGTLLVLFSQQERLAFTYYEPSYMAVGLIPYMTFSLLNKKIETVDIFFIILFVALGQSALFILLLTLTLSARLLLTSNKWKIFLTASLLSIASTVFIIDSYNNDTRANHLLVRAIIDEGFDLLTLLDRAGNRFPRMEAAYSAFAENLLLGVGSGNYYNYIYNIDFTHITHGIPWLEVHNQPPVNIFLEAGINAGIFGALLLVMVFTRFIFLSLFQCNDRRYFLIIILTFVAGLIETSYLRAYCWIFFGIVAGQVSNFNGIPRFSLVKLGQGKNVVFYRKRIGQKIS